MINPYTQRALIKLLGEALSALEHAPLAKSCADCSNMDNGICTLANIAPPPEVLKIGCEAWKLDENRPPF